MRDGGKVELGLSRGVGGAQHGRGEGSGNGSCGLETAVDVPYFALEL